MKNQNCRSQMVIVAERRGGVLPPFGFVPLRRPIEGRTVGSSLDFGVRFSSLAFVFLLLENVRGRGVRQNFISFRLRTPQVSYHGACGGLQR